MAVVDIFNRALSQVPARDKVSDPTENSKAAEACRLWYDITRQTVFRAAHWNSCKVTRNLGLLAERPKTDRDRTVFDESWPDPAYRFAYKYPVDCIQPRYTGIFSRFSVGLWNSPGGDVKAIFSNDEKMFLTYTKDIEDITLWDQSLELAVTTALAAQIVLPITGKRGRAQELLEMANVHIREAQAQFANEESYEQFETVPDWIIARGYAVNFPKKFIFETGPQLAISRI